MDIPEEHAQQLKELVADTPCSKGHECLKVLPGKLCKAEFGAGGKVLFCLKEQTGGCRYGTTFGHGMLCTCLVRKYIAEHLRA